jgi:soluble cytochrome b562
MSLWKHLFDSEYRQRRDIEELRHRMDAAAADTPDDQRDEVRALRRRVDQLELMVEALFGHLESKGELDREGFAKLMVQIDLADGVEDGKIGEDRSERARKCDECGRPVGRKRSECVYCGAAVERKSRRRRR